MSELINNREHRVTQLKAIIRHLHEGRPADEVRAQLSTLVGQTDHAEIAAMEQQLMAEGMPVEEVRSMCDLHAEVLRDVMRPVQVRPRIVAGHPVDTFQRENRAIEQAADAAAAALATLSAAPAGDSGRAALQAARVSVNALFDIEKHYQRKELLLFPFLEKHGITGPSKVMWAKDDEARSLLKALSEALAQSDVEPDEWRLVADTVGASALGAIRSMVFKEEQILLPLALDTLTREEWGEVWRESPRIGWCLVEPGTGFMPPDTMVPAETANVPAGRALVLPTGHLSIEQLEALFATLPVDLTFVDADDRVAFFSEGPRRVFARSKTVIGRKVQHCHPPHSVEVVERILDDFRAGRHDVAEFWIEFHGRFVHIRYFAVHGGDGQYLGCLEVTQDVTQIRQLEGERRLLQYRNTAAV